MVLISTFTSPKEREILRRGLAKKRRIIHVCPQGIPLDLSPAQKLALQENRLLFLSTQPTGSRLNKQVSTWCNEYMLRQASEW